MSEKDTGAASLSRSRRSFPQRTRPFGRGHDSGVTPWPVGTGPLGTSRRANGAGSAKNPGMGVADPSDRVSTIGRLGLSLLAGPANAGKVALLLERYVARLDDEPFLIVPYGS